MFIEVINRQILEDDKKSRNSITELENDSIMNPDKQQFRVIC